MQINQGKMMNILAAVSPYVGVNILILLYLAYGVVKIRRTEGIALGDGGKSHMQRAVRAHGNATEYMPMAMIGLVVMASTGQPTWAVHLGGLAFTIGRALHAYGLSRVEGVSFGRFYGTAITWVSLVWIAVFCLLGTFA